MIKRLTCIAAALVALVALPAFAQGKEKVVLLLNWYVYSEHAPFFLGKERGYFDQEGHRPRHPGGPRLRRDRAGRRRRARRPSATSTWRR